MMKMQKFKHGNYRFIVKYCDYEKFTWHAIKYRGVITIYINSVYTINIKSKILHKVIKYYGGKG